MLTRAANNLQRDAMQETFLDVRNDITATIRKFQRMYPIANNFDDLLGIAHEAFMYAYERHDATKCFHKWIRFIVWVKLTDNLRKNAMRDTRCKMEYLPEDLAAPDTSRLDDLVDTLSEDAMQAMKLVLVMDDTAVQTKRSSRAMVRSVLSDLGWTRSRVTGVFEEIANALSGDE